MERVLLSHIEGIYEDYIFAYYGTRVVMLVGNKQIVIDKIN